MRKVAFTLVVVLIVVSSQLSCRETVSKEIENWRTKSIPLRISEETTFITEPLTPDGSMVDYGLYFERKYAPKNPEDNGFRDVVNAFGRKQISSKFGTPPEEAITDEYWTFLCERLRLDPEAAPTVRIKHSYEAVRETIKTEGQKGVEEAYWINQRLLSNPWTGRDFPEMGKWIAESEPYIALFSEALKKPAYNVVYCRTKPGKIYVELAATSATSQIHRNFCRDLVVRANYFIGMERHDDAWKEIQTLFRLVRAFERMPCHTAFLYGSAFEQLAQRTVARFIVYGKLNGEQWTRFAGDFDPLVLPGSRVFPLDIRRLEDLSILSGLASCRNEKFWKANATPLDEVENESWPFPQGKVLSILSETDGVDWNVMARAVNAYYDGRQGKEVSKEFDLAAYKSVLSEASRNIADWQRMDLSERSRRLGLLYGYALILSDRSLNRTDRFYQAQTNRLRLGFALGRFKSEFGRYPEKLEELVERKLIPEVPSDATYSTKQPIPFGYRLLPPDGYVLYGIDPKIGDDGGDKSRNDQEVRFPTIMDDRRILVPPSGVK